MITLIIGENTFENERALQVIVASFKGVPERVDGAELEPRSLPDLLMGATLFASERLVIIKRLSENKTVWGELATWLKRISPDVHLVLVEEKPDKRAKAFKELQKVAVVKESRLWTDRDRSIAERWVVEEAKRLGFSLDKKSAYALVERVGVDQWLLRQALEKLALVDDASPAVIEQIIDANPAENVFLLFELALKGERARIKKMLASLEMTEDPYRLMGLLSTQAMQLAVLAVAAKPSAEVAKEIGVHPFALSKLAPYAKRLGRGGAKQVIAMFAEADKAAKTSAVAPWLLIERALMGVTTISQ